MGWPGPNSTRWEYPFKIPTTSILARENEAAAVPITALAAGAGPPANRMATRRILLVFAAWDGESERGVADIRDSFPFLRGQQ
jgi:hypothetical protein